MSAIDWTPFDKWPEDTITCRCGARFRSHGKGTHEGRAILHSRKPCPSCGATEGHAGLSSDPMPMNSGAVDVGRIPGTGE